FPTPLYYIIYTSSFSFLFFFFNDTATTEIYTLSLHDALPICGVRQRRRAGARWPPLPRGSARTPSTAQPPARRCGARTRSRRRFARSRGPSPTPDSSARPHLPAVEACDGRRRD